MAEERHADPLKEQAVVGDKVVLSIHVIRHPFVIIFLSITLCITLIFKCLCVIISIMLPMFHVFEQFFKQQMYVFTKKCVNIHMHKYIFSNHWTIPECSKGAKVVFVVSDSYDIRHAVLSWICCKTQNAAYSGFKMLAYIKTHFEISAIELESDATTYM